MKNLQVLLLLVVPISRGLRKKASSLSPHLRFNPLILQLLVDRFLLIQGAFNHLLFHFLSLRPSVRKAGSPVHNVTCPNTYAGMIAYYLPIAHVPSRMPDRRMVRA